jgi:cytochrome P450
VRRAEPEERRRRLRAKRAKRAKTWSPPAQFVALSRCVEGGGPGAISAFKRPSPSIYSPFGGGNRRCLGATFARYEAAIVLGTLLRERELEMLDDRVEWGRGKLILEPLGGVRMRVRPRKRQMAMAS